MIKPLSIAKFINLKNNNQGIKLFKKFTKDTIDILWIERPLLKWKLANPKGSIKNYSWDIANNAKYKHINDNDNSLEGINQGKNHYLWLMLTNIWK